MATAHVATNGHHVEEKALALAKPAAAADKSGIFLRAAATCTWVVESVLDSLTGLKKEGQETPFLKGNYAPVLDQRFDEKLEVVEGQLPKSLNGAFLRNGPNPALPPVGGYHWFDGDGMIHAVRIKDGAASYCNRFVETARVKQEWKVGYGSYSKFGDTKGKVGLVHLLLRTLKEKLGVVGPAELGRGTANTALVYHAEKLLALHEGDMPYVLRVACEGIVETLGRMGLHGALDHSFTAHPKVDPATGEMFFFGYEVARAPHCWYSLIDKDGNLVHDYPVPLPHGIMMHDFAVTAPANGSEGYAIFLDCPLRFDPKRMVKDNTLPFKFDKSVPSRFGVLPRYAKDASAIRWFETPPMVILHTVNAWQEGNKIRLFGCAFKEFDLDGFTAECSEDELPHVTEICMDLDSGEATVRRVCELAGDFPVVPPVLVGRKTRYAYMGWMEPDGHGVPNFVGIVKIDLLAKDLAGGTAGRIRYGGHKFGGEAYFAPSGGRDEDAGHLLTFVHDEDANVTELQVFDAKTMAEKPVARMRMPRRVPYGFHSLWVSEEQLQAQAHSDAPGRAVSEGRASRGGVMPKDLGGALKAD